MRKKADVKEVRGLINNDMKVLEEEIVSLSSAVETVYQEVDKRMGDIPSLKDYNMLNKLVSQKADVSDFSKVRDLERNISLNMQELQN